MLLPAFDHTSRTRLIFGSGALNRAGTLAAELGATRVLIVTDPGIARTGYPDKALALVQAHPPRQQPPSVTGKPFADVLAEEETHNRESLAWMHKHIV